MNEADGLAVLRFEMVEEIPAFILKELVALVDDTYFMHLYLNRAEEAQGVFPEEYGPTPEETLYINRLEIGTPNFVEFTGLIDLLVQTFQWLGGLAGISYASGQILKHVKTFWEIRELRLKVKQKEREEETAAREGRLIEERLLVDPNESDPYVKALRLRNHLTNDALAHKKEFSESARDRAALITSWIYSPTIVVFEPKTRG